MLNVLGTYFIGSFITLPKYNQNATLYRHLVFAGVVLCEPFFVNSLLGEKECKNF